MTTGSIDQGDEIAVGACRMFLLRIDEDQEQAERGRSAVPDDERTRVMPAPIVPAVPRRSQPRGIGVAVEIAGRAVARE